MSAEELKEQIDSAVEQAIVGDCDLAKIEQTLTDAQERVEDVRRFRGDDG